MKSSFTSRIHNTWKAWSTAIIRSVTDLDYYGEMLNTSVRRSAKIVAVAYVLVGAVLTIVLSLTTFRQWRQNIDTLQAHVVQSFPQTLEYRWDGTALSATPPSSLEIDFPEGTDWDEYKTFITIDPARTTPENTDAFLFVGSNALAVSIDQTWNDIPLSEVFDTAPVTINAATLQAHFQDWQRGVDAFFLILPMFAFPIISIGLFFARVVMLVIDTIIVHFVFTLMKKPIPYPKVFQLLLHVLIPAELINQITLILYPHSQLPMFTIAFWLFTTILLWHLRNLHVVRFEVKEKE